MTFSVSLWRTGALVMHFALYASRASAQSTRSTESVYTRPINDDCVARDLGLSQVGASGLYFPSEYVLVGTSGADGSSAAIASAAEGFAVTYYDTYKVVENRVSNITYVLYECGTDVPRPEDVPKDAVFFQVPLTSVSVSETVPYAFLEALEVVDRVHDVSSFVTSACGQKQVACGQVAPGYVDFSTFQVNDTALAAGARVADAVILGTAGAGMGAPVLAFDAENDPGLLNRAEWVKYLGLFFNKEKQASALYGAIVESYEEVKREAREAVQGAAEGKEPVIAWVSRFEYGDEEHFDVSFADYKTDLVRDVSGTLPVESAQALVDAVPGTRLGAFSADTVEFAWDDPTGETSFKSEAEARAAFQEFLGGVDAIVDETYAADPAAYDFAAEYGFAAPKLVYRVDGKLSAENGYDWFESSFVRPDLMLRDFMRIADSVRAGENVEGFEFTWLRHLDEAPVVVTADECQRIQSCNDEPAPICPFVKSCGDGTTALLQEDASCDDGAQCCYERCVAVVGSQGGKNAAQMAAPAVIFITLLIVFVEALLHFC